MRFNNLQQQCYDRAAFICSRSEKNSGNVEKRLLDWGLSAEDADPVLKKLIGEKFIDDERFARSYVKDKFRFNKWGKIKIIHQLRAEKISSAVILQALAEIDDEQYREALKKLLAEKDKSVKAGNPYERRGKLFRFAQGRGFEPELIHKLIDEIID
ncbi:MAG: regulatory protein RecX [Prolixibacteraceae bacterium]